MTEQEKPSSHLSAYRDELYRFILSRVNDAAAADDIVQDVLLKAWLQRGSLKEPESVRAWLYRITRNQIIDFYRSHKPAAELPVDLLEEPSDEEVNRAEQELAQCLIPLLDDVPEPYRQALTLADVQGRRQREIAEQLGLSLSGAKSRVQRGRKMLKNVLLDCCRVEVDRRQHAFDYDTKRDCSSTGNSGTCEC